MGGAPIYAVIETGGKQYKVVAGQTLEVELIALGKGKNIELDRVLVIADGEDVTFGNPTIEGARVLATSLGDQKGEKILIGKYKAKTRYRRKNGHRQQHTRLEIKQILKPGEKAKAARPKRKKMEAEAPVETPTAEAATTGGEA